MRGEFRIGRRGYRLNDEVTPFFFKWLITGLVVAVIVLFLFFTLISSPSESTPPPTWTPGPTYTLQPTRDCPTCPPPTPTPKPTETPTPEPPPGWVNVGYKFDVVIIFDNSWSMNGARNETARRLIPVFIDRLNPETKVALVKVETGATIVIELTTDKEQVKEAIQQIQPQPENWSQLGLGLLEAQRILLNNDNIERPTIVLVSDGEPCDSDDPQRNTTLRNDTIVLAEFLRQENGIRIFGLGIGLEQSGVDFLEVVCGPGNWESGEVESMERLLQKVTQTIAEHDN